MLQIEFGGPDVWPAAVDKKFCVPKQCKSLINSPYNDWFVNADFKNYVFVNGYRKNANESIRMWMRMLKSLQVHNYF